MGLLDYPFEYNRMRKDGIEAELPTQRDSDRGPAYVLRAEDMECVDTVLAAMCPRIGELNDRINKYKHEMIQAVYPKEIFLLACANEWDQFQQAWKSEGWDHEYIPYPYTETLVE